MNLLRPLGAGLSLVLAGAEAGKVVLDDPRDIRAAGSLNLSGGVPTTLGALSVNPAVITENSAAGAIVGAIVGARAGSVVTITGTASGRMGISAGNVVAGATNTDYETATSYDITLRETNGAYPNSPKDTVITIAVADVNIALSPLTLSAASVAENTAAGVLVGAVQGLSAGSVLTISDTAGSRFALSGTNVVTGAVKTDYETATTHNITLTETLGDSSNSPRNTVLAIGVSDVVVEGPTYAQFLAHIATLAVNGTVAWDGNLPNSASRFLMTAGAFSPIGNLFGSSWMSYFYQSASVNRLVQHGMPSYAKFAEVTGGGDQVYFHYKSLGGSDYFQELDRNSYTSLTFSDGNAYPTFACDDLIYFDRTAGQAYRMNPQLGTGPTLYTWAF